MFTGIIKAVVPAGKITRDSGSMQLTFATLPSWNLEEGESINIDGVCSTIEKITKATFSVFYMPETIARTSLAVLSPSHLFNLERSLTRNDLIGGHLVSGHVDTTAKVAAVKKDKDMTTLFFTLPLSFTKYIIYKGSIAVNGVSLTVVDVTKISFSVSLIPFTLTRTNLGALTKGDSVNIEVDMIGKYIEKLLPSH